MAVLKMIRPFPPRPISDMWRVALFSLALLTPGGLVAAPLPDALRDPKLLGSSTFRFLGLPIYDAKLYTPGGAAFSWNEDIGLQLTYRKNLAQKALVESTLDEMARQGNPAPTEAQLEVCFQTVSKGDTYLAISEGPDKVGFWRNGDQTCTLSSPGIKRSFMSIFLGNNTRSARFTRQLKGL